MLLFDLDGTLNDIIMVIGILRLLYQKEKWCCK
jgi:hypothetical protein